MTKKELTAFRMDPEVMKALRVVKAREGIPFSVQIHFAIRAWLKRKGVKVGACRASSTKKRG